MIGLKCMKCLVFAGIVVVSDLKADDLFLINYFGLLMSQPEFEAI